MFQLRYAAQEVWRRGGRTALTALGLAAGVGLVIGIVGISKGLDQAQGQVLSPLHAVGTDILVTRVVGAGVTDAGTTPTTVDPNAAADDQINSLLAGGTSGFFGGDDDSINTSDAAALVNENSSVITDLSKLGKPGDKFSHDFFLPATLLTFPDDAVGTVSKLPGVGSAVGGLTVVAEHQSGTVPKIVTQIQAGGNTVSGLVSPPPMTASESSGFRNCLTANHAIPEKPKDKNAPPPPVNNAAFEKCLPKRFKTFKAQLQAPIKTIQKAVNPPKTDTTTSSYTAAGVDPASPHSGLITANQITSGRFINPGAADEVIISAAYADKKQLKLDDTIPINDKTFKVVGLANPALAGQTADIYFPLTTLQDLATKQSRVNTVLVKADDASSVDDVAGRIRTALPGAQVVTAKELNQQITGSLADAKKLAGRLGSVLAAVALAAAFIIAVLLTLSSVAKRVKEIGTLRALGWSKTRVVNQIVGETLIIGAIGGLLGVAVGYGVAAGVGALSPSLTASGSAVPGVGASAASSIFGPAAQAATAGPAGSIVHLHAPVQMETLALGIALALIGGLLAGSIGGWRAARLVPARALQTIG